MPLKQTHFYRDFAIAHRVFATEQTEEIYHQFVVTRVGSHQQLFSHPTLADARTAIDALVSGQTYAADPQPMPVGAANRIYSRA
jgi:hypothetical protein